jgi:hypothetical protein
MRSGGGVWSIAFASDSGRPPVEFLSETIVSVLLNFEHFNMQNFRKIGYAVCKIGSPFRDSKK